MSLILAKDKHKVIKNEAFNKDCIEIYEYTGNRVWSLDTAYIDIYLDIDKTNNKNYKIIPSENVVYYKVNLIDLDKMEYTSRQGLELFKNIYIYRRDNI